MVTDRAQIFKAWFAVMPAASRLLVALHDAAGEVVPFADLIQASGQTSNGVTLSIKLLRDAMDVGSIRNVNGVGYRLTAVGMADCEAAITDATRERAA